MAIGDVADFSRRLAAVLPRRWFADNDPVLGSALAGFGQNLADLWDLLTYATDQTRLLTATDGFVDLIGNDFLGTALMRRPNETDRAWALRIQREVLRPRNTRAAIVQVIHDLTGNTPTIFRPASTADTGGWGTGAMGYGVAGAYGSLAMPFQAFVTIERGTAPGAAGSSNAAYGQSGWGSALGGYGYGAIGYGNGLAAQGAVIDSDIYAAVARVTSAGHTNWVRIFGTPPLPLAGLIPGQTMFPFYFADR